MEDYLLARSKKMNKITNIAKRIGISKRDLILYGDYKAKINIKDHGQTSNLILVTAISPTPLGEGKTTVAIGIHDGMYKSGIKSSLVLREPSMGPVFGIKGGATGGGKSQVLPMDDINLHFTGDFHAITSANNLICACIDNSLKHDNPLKINPSAISFCRTLDVNDRALREVEVALGGKINGLPRTDYFTITAASEIMAVFCLATNMEDLRRRLGQIIIGRNYDNEYVYLKDLEIVGSVLALLKDAIKPNLVQTMEGNPVIIHGGPFANIAHGCNSIIATKAGMSLAPYTITEAGFGADLGALKFFDIKCRKNNLNPLGVILVCTIKALKYHGGCSLDKIKEENLEYIKLGFPNLEVHISNLKKFNTNIIITLNKHDTDSKKEIDLVRQYVDSLGLPFTVNEAYAKGGKGAVSIVNEIVKLKPKKLSTIYNLNESLSVKIEKVCKEIYRCKDIEYSEEAHKKLVELSDKFSNYPICIAKTQYSISDDKTKLGKPEGYTLHVTDLKVYNGAEFITVFLGDIMTMPGLSKNPAATKIDVDQEGEIVGIF